MPPNSVPYASSQRSINGSAYPQQSVSRPQSIERGQPPYPGHGIYAPQSNAAVGNTSGNTTENTAVGMNTIGNAVGNAVVSPQMDDDSISDDPFTGIEAKLVLNSWRCLLVLQR
jgi:hypothetical protein